MQDYTFIDFDGVILDSEERMLERKYKLGFHDHNDKTQYLNYFKYTLTHDEEWDYIIKDAEPINNSIEIIKELEKLKKEIAILTKIHTFNEMKVKVEVVREKYKIKCPIIFVPNGVKKHQVIIPNGQILIDDSNKNIYQWKENGGLGYIFDKSLNENTLEKVKSLEFLLKR